jgi:FKBP-type peptidyl-prolyl cis-trans isomerase
MNLRILGLALVVALFAAGCKGAPENTSTSSTDAASTTPAAPSAADPAAEAAGGKVHKLASGLQYTDLVVGSGKMAEPGMNVSVHYTGWITDRNAPFDSSVDRGQPFQFQLGAGQVIQGWDEGVKGMRIGGKRHLTIPPDLGYGARGAGGVIPPNATLQFEVELLDVK